MHTDLEPIAPTEALELYLTDRRGDLRDSTIRSHRSRLSIFIDWCRNEEGIEDLTISRAVPFTSTKFGAGMMATSPSRR